MARTLRLVNMTEHPDFDEVQVREDDIGPDEDTAGWIKVTDPRGDEFMCSPTVAVALLLVLQPHAAEDQ